MIRKIAIVGGGAAGFFAAIASAEAAKKIGKSVDVRILESSEGLLKKVRISGGGRCNVTHHLFEVRRFCENYPRGSQELISAMQRFQAKDTVEWFAKRGVTLVAEEDGRMFPDTSDSETIIQCFMRTAQGLGIKILTKHSVQSIGKTSDNKLRVNLSGGEIAIADSVMIATGSSQSGYRLAKELGHTITELAPSLFSFKISDALLTDLSGLSFPNAEVKLQIEGAKPFKEKGPLLITHWGLSGPAVLKISAWAAREMMHADYKGRLIVNWLGLARLDDAVQLLKQLKADNTKTFMSNAYPTVLASRFWLKLLAKCAISESKRWADLSGKELTSLSEALFATNFQVEGKNRYKDEFVECGGVSLKEINFKTMESKICPGLFFAGEVLDIDGITGGFNFQNAWTGGWIAGQNM